MDYKKAGVDIEKGDQFVKNIASMVKSSQNKNCLQGLGGYASLYNIGSQYIAATNDGVGTKVLLAKEKNYFDGIGQDLVAMSVNDLICVGAKPLFFLDYYASSYLELEVAEKVISSIVKACKEANMALVGGETAEMPDLYQKGDFDLAGFAVGIASEEELFSNKNFKEGDKIIAIESSGFHSNGYSLLRKVEGLSEEEKQELLEPTKIYVNLVEKFRKQIKGAAHITGGGLNNLCRLTNDFAIKVENLPSVKEIAPIFAKIMKKLDISQKEAYSTFNMGMGICFVVDQKESEKLLEDLKNEGVKAWSIGYLSRGKGELVLPF